MESNGGKLEDPVASTDAESQRLPIALWNEISGLDPSKRVRHPSSSISSRRSSSVEDQHTPKRRKLNPQMESASIVPDSAPRDEEHTEAALGQQIEDGTQPETEEEKGSHNHPESTSAPQDEVPGDAPLKPSSQPPSPTKAAISEGDEGSPRAPPQIETGTRDSTTGAEPTPSKSARKKIARRQAWEAGRQDRRDVRRQKKQDKRTTQKAQTSEKIANGELTPAEIAALTAPSPKTLAKKKSQPFPIAFVLDCSFDDLMTENEITSLGSQLTRCYADNRQATKRANLVVTGWGGRLKSRFEGLLSNCHKNWKGVHFYEEGYEECQEKIFAGIRAERSAVVEEAHDPPTAAEPPPQPITTPPAATASTAPAADPSAPSPPDPTHPSHASLIYLTSDSPHTITSLSPHKAYIIGGLVDRNRHKGICAARAHAAGLATARLPISDYLRMSTRAVLTTNQVVAILLRWLEVRDWGMAFVGVVPKRKGAVLKTDGEEQAVEAEEAEEAGGEGRGEEVGSS